MKKTTKQNKKVSLISDGYVKEERNKTKPNK